MKQRSGVKKRAARLSGMHTAVGKDEEGVVKGRSSDADACITDQYRTGEQQESGCEEDLEMIEAEAGGEEVDADSEEAEEGGQEEEGLDAESEENGEAGDDDTEDGGGNGEEESGEGEELESMDEDEDGDGADGGEIGESAEPVSDGAATKASASSWASLGLDLRLLKAVRKLELQLPSAVQAQMIPLALAGKDIVARAPTGSGKTIAYALPVLQKVLSRQDSASLTSEAISALVLVPTRELCQQALGVLGSLLGHAGAGHVRVLQLATPTDAALLRTGAPPDVLIATPSQLLAHLRASKQSGRSLSSLATLVLDEADLLLSYGYGDDIAAIGAFLPQTVHTLLLSATITPDLDGITALLLHNPTTLDCADDAAASGKLRQFYLRCSHADKFLVMYALFKLNRIPGRSLIFVNSVERGFRLKLFLEQFGVSSGILNCELPVESRWHAIQAFNRGLFDILIATDDPKLMLGQGGADKAAGSGGGAAAGAAGGGAPVESRGRKGAERRPTQADAEFGVSRGVDFCDVTAVVNMDLPTGAAVYRHRIGRTARAGQGGTAISMVDDKDANDYALLEQLLEEFGNELHQFQVDMTKLGAFRYRVEDAMRAVTRQAVKEARLKEIKQEMINSRKLTEHFEANPDDLQALRHDKPLAVMRKQPHLANVPTYLKPDTENATGTVSAVGSSNRLRLFGNKRRLLFGKNKKKRKDPLHSFGHGRGRGLGAGRGRGSRGGRGKS